MLLCFGGRSASCIAFLWQQLPAFRALGDHALIMMVQRGPCGSAQHAPRVHSQQATTLFFWHSAERATAQGYGSGGRGSSQQSNGMAVT